MTVYYVDYANGSDTAPAVNPNWGQRMGSLTIDSTADTTHFVDAALTVPTGIVDDSYNGAFFYNRTRSQGALVTDYVDSTQTITLGTAITGMAAGDDYYLIMAWKTINKAVTALAAGDIGYVRAGTTDIRDTASIDINNTGTPALTISLIGMGTGSATLETTDNSATEAWHEASTARPILDFNNTAYYLNFYATDDFWIFKNIDLRNTNGVTWGSLSVTFAKYVTISNCIIRDSQHASGRNTRSSMSMALFEDCAWLNANNVNFDDLSGNVHTFRRCTFNGGALGTTYGLYGGGSCFTLIDCQFGNVTTHSSADIWSNSSNEVWLLRNVKLNSTTPFAWYTYSNAVIHVEDDAQVYGAHTIYARNKTTTRDTSVVRSGGASSSAKLMPTSLTGLNRPANIGDYTTPDFRVWCPASSTTITVYIRSVTTWGGTYPTASELWLEGEYVSNATSGSIARTVVKSTQTLSDATTWVGFSITCTPAVASFVDLKVMLGKYVASNGIYVDIKPVVS